MCDVLIPTQISYVWINKVHFFTCHRGFLRLQWQICGREICPFPQFTANFITFHFLWQNLPIFVAKFGKIFPLLSHNSFKAVCYTESIVQCVFKLLLLPAVTLNLNRVLSSFSFTRVTICAVIYAACCFVFVFAAGVLFPFTWFLTRYGKIPWFRSEEGKICSPCYYTPTTFIIQLLDLLQSSQFSLN